MKLPETRRCATRELADCKGVLIDGTVGILLRAKRVGLVPLIKPLLDDLVSRDFRLSESIRARALQLAGE